MKDLQELQKYYESNLCDRKFVYQLADGKTIQIVFYRESFCHLLGIQHVIGSKAYLGKAGYNRIQAGLVTINHLKSMNRAGFAKISSRIKHFMCMGHLAQNGELFSFYPERVDGGTRIHATHLVHEKSCQLYLHLFLAIESQKHNLCAPVSYIVLTERDDNPRLYIDGQIYKKVIKRSVLPMWQSPHP